MTICLQIISIIFLVSALNIEPTYYTNNGKAFCGDSAQLLQMLPDNSVQLVITSPPFALQRKKDYGNVDQEEYVDWIEGFARIIYAKLKANGSFVLDLGGAYKKGIPVRSLYNFRVLLRLCDVVGFHLAEDFYWHNPSKLPGPIEWVNKRKIRVKDSVNTIWWFSKTPYPKANVTNVLTEYSDRMKKLLQNPEQYYRPKSRPSGHDISNRFAKDNGGAIPPNMLSISNSDSSSTYLRGCKATGIKAHPARFPAKLPEFFVRFLTDPGDIVVDPFAGSNTTGSVAENEQRQWVSIENFREYVATSAFRFIPQDMHDEDFQDIYDRIMRGESVDLVGRRLL